MTNIHTTKSETQFGIKALGLVHLNLMLNSFILMCERKKLSGKTSKVELVIAIMFT